jgi:hypothetical protein
MTTLAARLTSDERARGRVARREAALRRIVARLKVGHAVVA